MRTEFERIHRKLDQRWRMRCPEGHADLRDTQGPTVYCRSWGASYGYGVLLDASSDAMPPGRR